MFVYIETIGLEKIRIGKHFSLQLNKYTDISNAQLLANVRFVNGDTIRENFLFCKTLVKTTREEIFCITTEYLENGNLHRENFISRGSDDKSVDIETIVLEKICIGKHFSLQLDEYTDISVTDFFREF